MAQAPQGPHRVADLADSVEDDWPARAESPLFLTLVREQRSMAASHPPSGYDRSQNGSTCLLLYFMALFTGLLSWPARDDRWLASILLGSALMMLMLAASFHHLRVRDRGEHLEVAFGPLPLFRRLIRYADIRSVEAGRLTLLDGLGLRRSKHGGWTWTIRGRDCVVVNLDRSSLRIGTDDPQGLIDFLQSRH